MGKNVKIQEEVRDDNSRAKGQMVKPGQEKVTLRCEGCKQDTPVRVDWLCQKCRGFKEPETA